MKPTTKPPISLAPPPESMDVSRFKAVDPPKPTFVELEARRPWLWVLIVAIIAAIAIAFVVNV